MIHHYSSFFLEKYKNQKIADECLKVYFEKGIIPLFHAYVSSTAFSKLSMRKETVSYEKVFLFSWCRQLALRRYKISVYRKEGKREGGDEGRKEGRESGK